MWRALCLCTYVLYGCGEDIKVLPSGDSAHSSAVLNNAQANKQDRQVRKGVVFIDKAAAYVDFGFNTQLVRPHAYRMRFRHRPLLGGELLWRGREIYVITLRNGYFDDSLGEEKIILNYKIENNKGFVSNDKKKWFPLSVTVISEKSYRSTPPEMYMVSMVLHLECPWFSGDYEVTEDLPHAHPPG